VDLGITQEIAALARDRESGATALTGRAIALLRRAASRDAVEEIAAALCRAQPSMAGFHTVARIALEADDLRLALDRLAGRLARAPAAVARYAADLILLGRTDANVRIVTCSRSAMVEAALLAIAGRVRLVVCCAEGRPALEGRALAESLATRGIAVELYTDAGISSAVGSADAGLVGADAVSAARFINKVGTGAVCALAAGSGVPTYVLTGREKILSAELLEQLPLRQGDPDEVTSGAAAGIVVRNPYFEMISTDWLSGIVTDGGVLAPADVELAII